MSEDVLKAFLKEWFKPHWTREDAVQVLSSNPTVNFIVRGSSNAGALALSVCGTGESGSNIWNGRIFYNAPNTNYRLEPSSATFETLPQLIAHIYDCPEAYNIPTRLRLRGEHHSRPRQTATSDRSLLSPAVAAAPVLAQVLRRTKGPTQSRSRPASAVSVGSVAPQRQQLTGAPRSTASLYHDQSRQCFESDLPHSANAESGLILPASVGKIKIKRPAAVLPSSSPPAFTWSRGTRIVVVRTSAGDNAAGLTLSRQLESSVATHSVMPATVIDVAPGSSTDVDPPLHHGSVLLTVNDLDVVSKAVSDIHKMLTDASGEIKLKFGFPDRSNRVSPPKPPAALRPESAAAPSGPERAAAMVKGLVSGLFRSSPATIVPSVNKRTKAANTVDTAGDTMLEILASKLQAGLPVSDRKYHMRTYKNVFVGSEAVEWMIKNRSAGTIDDALDLGQKMVDAGFFAHVTNEHRFLNATYFYRWSRDGDIEEGRETVSDPVSGPPIAPYHTSTPIASRARMPEPPAHLPDAATSKHNLRSKPIATDAGVHNDLRGSISIITNNQSNVPTVGSIVYADPKEDGESTVDDSSRSGIGSIVYGNPSKQDASETNESNGPPLGSIVYGDPTDENENAVDGSEESGCTDNAETDDLSVNNMYVDPSHIKHKKHIMSSPLVSSAQVILSVQCPDLPVRDYASSSAPPFPAPLPPPVGEDSSANGGPQMNLVTCGDVSPGGYSGTIKGVEPLLPSPPAPPSPPDSKFEPDFEYKHKSTQSSPSSPVATSVTNESSEYVTPPSFMPPPVPIPPKASDMLHTDTSVAGSSFNPVIEQNDPCLQVAHWHQQPEDILQRSLSSTKSEIDDDGRVSTELVSQSLAVARKILPPPAQRESVDEPSAKLCEEQILISPAKSSSEETYMILGPTTESSVIEVSSKASQQHRAQNLEILHPEQRGSTESTQQLQPMLSSSSSKLSQSQMSPTAIAAAASGAILAASKGADSQMSSADTGYGRIEEFQRQTTRTGRDDRGPIHVREIDNHLYPLIPVPTGARDRIQRQQTSSYSPGSNNVRATNNKELQIEGPVYENDTPDARRARIAAAKAAEESAARYPLVLEPDDNGSLPSSYVNAPGGTAVALAADAERPRTSQAAVPDSVSNSSVESYVNAPGGTAVALAADAERPRTPQAAVPDSVSNSSVESYVNALAADAKRDQSHISPVTRPTLGTISSELATPAEIKESRPARLSGTITPPKVYLAQKQAFFTAASAAIARNPISRKIPDSGSALLSPNAAALSATQWDMTLQSKAAAMALLAKCSSGSFVVRCCSKPGFHCVSVARVGRPVWNGLIAETRSGRWALTKLGLGTELGKMRYNTLIEVVQALLTPGDHIDFFGLGVPLVVELAGGGLDQSSSI